MTRILAIDPGYERSAVVRLSGGRVTFAETSHNVSVQWALSEWLLDGVDIAVIEQIDSYGMPVGREVFETIYWTGRLAATIDQRYVNGSFNTQTHRLTRRAVKLQICGTATAKDANVRQALIDRYGGSKAEAIGTKKQPGPLYGVHGDEWAALALAVAWAEGAR